MLQAQGLSVEVGGRLVVESASFTVMPRDKVGLVGRNGAGKTSLFRVLGGAAEPAAGAPYEVEATHVLIATGATPRVLPGSEPDGERILSWRQVYDLDELPSHLVVIGSGVTGAEFASAYLAAGVEVTLVSSRDRVMPHEDPDAAGVIERVFRTRGMTVLGRSRAAARPVCLTPRRPPSISMACL